MSRGALVVIEGVDRCGKTSQSTKLVQSLLRKNIQADRMAFPDRTTWTGKVISQYLIDKTCKLSDQAIHLLFSANRWENVEKMKYQLNKGTTLIVDRYAYSGAAFSVAKGMNFHWCLQPEIGLPKPDLVIFLNIDPSTQMNRPDFGKERYENSDFQKKAHEVFQIFASTEDNWDVVNADRTFEEIHHDLLDKIEKKVDHIKNNNIPLEYIKNECGKQSSNNEILH